MNPFKGVIAFVAVDGKGCLQVDGKVVECELTDISMTTTMFEPANVTLNFGLVGPWREVEQ